MREVVRLSKSLGESMNMYRERLKNIKENTPRRREING